MPVLRVSKQPKPARQGTLWCTPPKHAVWNVQSLLEAIIQGLAKHSMEQASLFFAEPVGLHGPFGDSRSFPECENRVFIFLSAIFYLDTWGFLRGLFVLPPVWVDMK